MKLICPECGWIQKLDWCDVWLWFFSKNGGSPMLCRECLTEMVKHTDDTP